jgi:uncharacterized membrane protein
MHSLIAAGAAPGGSTTVNLSSSWSKIWTTLSTSTGFSSLQWVLTVVGLLLILGSVLRYVWAKRTGGQGGHQHIMWTLFIGAILMLPDVLVPVLLTIADALINSIAGVAGK